jgi:hypothetical protein
MLPVELTAFTVVVKQSSVDLAWHTSAETNSDVFIVERSADGRLFSAIATVPASGNTNAARSYKFTDMAAGITNTVYYRLKVVDRDGEFTYSQVIAANWNSSGALPAVKVYPTALRAFQPLQVQINSTLKQTITITFFDTRGKKLAQTTRQLAAGNNRFSYVPDAVLPHGLIYVQFTGEGINQSIPVLRHE